MSCRVNEELDNQQATAAQQSHRAAALLSALDELQEPREVSDSARGRLRGILSAPLEGISETAGAVSRGGMRSSGLIRQSSRLSGMSLGGCRGALLRLSDCPHFFADLITDGP